MLTQHQTEIVNKVSDSLIKNKFTLLKGSAGVGKALLNSELVLTCKGFIPISKLTLSDKVIGSDGKPKRLLGIYPQEKKAIYRITFNDNTYCDCSIDHLWTLYDYNKNKFVTITLRRIMFNDYKRFGLQLCSPIENYNDTTIEQRLSIYNSFMKKNSTKSKKQIENILDIGRSLGKFITSDKENDNYKIIELKDKYKSIVTITFLKEDYCTCIKVDSEDSLFVTRHFNLTHNTFVIPHIIKDYQNKLGTFIENKTVCSAPTNKAVSVIQSKIESKFVKFYTIHKLLGISQLINEETGEVQFKKVNNGFLHIFKLVIIDESSMLNSYIMDILKQEVYKYDVKILFLGDDKQLNPVNEEDSPVFISDYPTYSLTEIIRQSNGNPIIDLSYNLEKIKTKSNDIINDKGYLFSNDKAKVVNTLMYHKGSDDVKYLAWTNAEINKMNSFVRKLLYGENPDKFYVNEYVVFDAPYNDYITNEVIQIESLSVQEQEFYMYTYNNKMYSLKLKHYVINGSINIIHEDSTNRYVTELRKIKSLCKENKLQWITYYNVYSLFAHVKYNYAISVHKSQGSTYKKVIINLKDINRNTKEKEKQRLLYTAITRASDLVILYNS